MNANTRHSLRPVIAIFAVIALVLGAMMSFSARPASAASVEPVFVAGNPSCTDLGFAYGLKFNYPDDSTGGTYPIGTGSVTWSTDGVRVDWSSTFGLDAVIVKGGPNANLYVYNPESFGDIGLVSPINESNGQPYGLSHVEFCFDYELDVSKTAATSFTRTWTWDIDKSVTPAQLDMFYGDPTQNVTYTVAVTKGYIDSAFTVSGTITIFNPDPMYGANFSVADAVGGVPATVTCDTFYVGPASSVSCSYTANLGDTLPSDGTNVASVTTIESNVGGGTASARYSFGSATISYAGYDTINVVDTNGLSWTFGESDAAVYTRDFRCGGSTGQQDATATYANTATISETGQSDDASVTVNCYLIDVEKSATATHTRTWDWTIDKLADQSDLTLATGQVPTVNYVVNVDATYTDEFLVTGEITIHNPAPTISATITEVGDAVAPNTLGGSPVPGTVSCGVEFPYILGPGDTLTCTYEVELDSATYKTNKAWATLSSGRAFTDTANFRFGEPVLVDECAEITDTYTGVLGTVCATENEKSFSFAYARDIGLYAECGDYTVENTASFVTNDTPKSGSDSWTINVSVPCMGCTLTQGYWKTHSAYGPAPYDDAWLAIGPLGADTEFFNTGMTYYQVLNTPPAGNPYYILAQQYIAAELNIANGADSTDVDATMESVKAFFAENAPTTKWTKAQKAEMTSWATVLDNYNNGLIGPGHCDE